MIVKFNNQYLQDLYGNKKVAGKPKFSDVIIKKFRKLVQILEYTESSQQIYDFKSLHFEKLSGDLDGYYSCRVDIKYRLILSIGIDTILVKEIIVIEDLTNHYD
jgi:toxin HigB-1